MSKQTYYAVLPFEIGPRGKLMEGQAVPATSGDHAVRLAHRMEPRVAGAVAFSRTGDPETGDWDDAVILVVLGAVPPDLLESRAA
jgi:hypothetical protein